MSVAYALHGNAAMARKGDYLYQQPGSANWYIKLQYPKGTDRPTVRKSLGTSDKTKAAILAAGMIAEHRQAIFVHEAVRKGIPLMSEQKTGRYLEPGETVVYPGSQTITATKDSYISIVHDTGRVRTLPRTPMVRRTLNEAGEEARRFVRPPKPANKGYPVDDEIISDWVRLQRVGKFEEKKVRETYAAFRELTGKTLSDATLDDGEKLCEHLLQSYSYASVDNRVGLLRSAVNVAIRKRKLQTNPFARVMPEKQHGDERERLPFD